MTTYRVELKIGTTTLVSSRSNDRDATLAAARQLQSGLSKLFRDTAIFWVEEETVTKRTEVKRDIAVGDTVRIIKFMDSDSHPRVGQTYTVRRIDPAWNFPIDLGIFSCHYDEVELVNP